MHWQCGPSAAGTFGSAVMTASWEMKFPITCHLGVSFKDVHIHPDVALGIEEHSGLGHAVDDRVGLGNTLLRWMRNAAPVQ
jgi:hypothetical protein